MYTIQPTKEGNDIIIDGWENGIAGSPYKGIANIRNLNTSYYAGVAYVNYKRKLATLAESGTFWYAGTHSTNVSDNKGWLFEASPGSAIMTNPVGKAVSPAGLIYILDDTGQVWKQSAVNSSTFNLLGDVGRYSNGAGGIAYWNNYLAVFGNGLIEWCGDGSGDAGIINGNWNINSSATQPSAVLFTTAFGTNAYKMVFPTLTQLGSSLPLFQNGDPIIFSTTGTLSAPLVVGTTYYLSVHVVGISTFGAVSLRQNDTRSYLSIAPSSGTTSLALVTTWDGTTGTYWIIFSTGEARSTTLTNGSASFTVTALSTNETANIQIVIPFTSDGTGTETITDTVKTVPFGNCTNVTLFSMGTIPYSQFTLDPGIGSYGSYTDPTGATVTGVWKGASGIYIITMTNGEKVGATFTNNSPLISLAQPLTYISSGTGWTITLVNTSVTDYRAYVSKVNTNLLFSGGNNLSEIIYLPPPGFGTLLNFSPAIAVTNAVSARAVSLPESGDTITDMVDLRNNLIITGQNDFYTWDYVSGSVQAPSPVGAKIHRVFNLLSNIYILAGQKGSVYLSNGYSEQFLFKLPDYIAGVIDPVWLWGDIISHRSKIFFQALAQDTSGNNLLAGIFSLVVSPALTGEVASGLVMESQNSYGLIPSSGATSSGLLIDNEPSSNGQDSYYSAWSNGASLGGIDYNDTTPWGSNEPVIETDIIPIGNYLIKKTLGSIEFKLDRPLATGDSIALFWRPSLTDSYVSIPLIDTSSGLISNYGISAINQSQWAQFKITFSCASSGSSRIPLKELRLHLTP